MELRGGYDGGEKGPVLDVLEVDPARPGGGIREREEGSITPRFVI